MQWIDDCDMGDGKRHRAIPAFALIQAMVTRSVTRRLRRNRL